MAEWKCFWAEPTGRVRLSLRRYQEQSEPECPRGFGYHNASVVVGYSEMRPPLNVSVPVGDPRRTALHWPTICECGYVFHEDDQWQDIAEAVYVGDGREFVLAESPVGAMWNAKWLADVHHGGDGRSLILQTPVGAWEIDSPAADGRRWIRAGDPPRITVTPSIGIAGRFHAVLTDGVLREV